MMSNLQRADQEERSRAVDAFRSGVKDVLVATDVASKGLDFPNIQHVINYDMPDDIENYGREKRIKFPSSCNPFDDLHVYASSASYRSYWTIDK